MIPGTPYAIRPKRICFSFARSSGFLPALILPAFIFQTFFLLANPRTCRASDNYTPGAEAAAMGGVGVMREGYSSVWQNQAGLASRDDVTIGLHHENRFLVSELALSAIGIILPARSGTFGLNFTRFGYSSYHEDKVGLALGKNLSEKLSAGVQINYHHRFIDSEAPHRSTVSVETGFLAQPLPGMHIGVHLFNPAGFLFESARELGLPLIMRIGIAYWFDSRLFIGAEAELSPGQLRSAFRAGTEYRLNNYLYVRTGLSLQDYVQHSFGFGVWWNRIRADIAFSMQQLAGYTPHISLFYVF